MTYSIPGGDSLSTREKVEYIREKYPDSLAIDIARSIGVSRERIRQILGKLELETNVHHRLLRQERVNWECARPDCTNLKVRSTSVYCSMECYNQHIHPSRYLPCTECGTIVRVRHGNYKLRLERGYKNIFCSKPCFSSWRLGKTKLIMSSIRTFPEGSADCSG